MCLNCVNENYRYLFDNEFEEKRDVLKKQEYDKVKACWKKNE